MSRKTRFFLTMLLVATVLASAWGFQREYRAFFVLRGTANDQIAQLSAAGKNPPVPLSARNVRELVTTCANLREEAPLLKREPATLAVFSAACGRIADALLEVAPTNARALAMRLMMQTDPITAATLARAQSAAPDEPGPLRMRINAMTYRADADPGVLAVAEADFARAMESRWGRLLLARLYVEREDLRALLQKAAETVPPDAQADFIAAIKRAGQRGRLNG